MAYISAVDCLLTELVAMLRRQALLSLLVGLLLAAVSVAAPLQTGSGDGWDPDDAQDDLADLFADYNLENFSIYMRL